MKKQEQIQSGGIRKAKLGAEVVLRMHRSLSETEVFWGGNGS